ncbi:MAG: hypothetical protein DMG17_29765 [Acidobacteria bacterium]|nr:MAG: hypothetical protein DMG17_29765 [Acidobacteriota bacterium]
MVISAACAGVLLHAASGFYRERHVWRSFSIRVRCCSLIASACFDRCLTHAVVGSKRLYDAHARTAERDLADALGSGRFKEFQDTLLQISELNGHAAEPNAWLTAVTVRS